VQAGGLLIVKKDGRREPYQREKLEGGIRKACEKRPMPIGTIERAVDDIDAQLHRLGRAEVDSSVVGDLVMERLKEMDHIAYIRFASVYREFRDLEDVRRELEALVAPTSKSRRGDGRRRRRSQDGQLPLIPSERLEKPAEKVNNT
jgi:transcriptional repressor NrdR